MFPEEDGFHDIDMGILEAAEVYVQTLAVPGRILLDDPQVQRGERLFADANCASCHVSEMRTGNHEIPSLVNQTIHAYTDLLLHDMGADLADNRPDFQADGNEWRTPAMANSSSLGHWPRSNSVALFGYLHDGRARTLEEAILWHGGEAEASKGSFRTMPEGDRPWPIPYMRSTTEIPSSERPSLMVLAVR